MSDATRAFLQRALTGGAPLKEAPGRVEIALVGELPPDGEPLRLELARLPYDRDADAVDFGPVDTRVQAYVVLVDGQWWFWQGVAHHRPGDTLRLAGLAARLS